MRLLLILAVVLWTGQLHAAVHAAEEPTSLCEVCVLAEVVDLAEPDPATLIPPARPAPVCEQVIAPIATVIPPPARAPPPRAPPLSN